MARNMAVYINLTAEDDAAAEAAYDEELHQIIESAEESNRRSSHVTVRLYRCANERTGGSFILGLLSDCGG